MVNDPVQEVCTEEVFGPLQDVFHWLRETRFRNLMSKQTDQLVICDVQQLSRFYLLTEACTPSAWTCDVCLCSAKMHLCKFGFFSSDESKKRNQKVWNFGVNQLGAGPRPSRRSNHGAVRLLCAKQLHCGSTQF